MRYQVSNSKGQMRFKKVRDFFHGTGVNVRPIVLSKNKHIVLRDVDVHHTHLSLLQLEKISD